MFESEVLKTFNVALSQITPNIWAFTREFEILWGNLEVSPTTGLFFSFYDTKATSKGGFVTLDFLSGRVIFPPYSNNYNNLKDMYVRVRGCDG